MPNLLEWFVGSALIDGQDRFEFREYMDDLRDRDDLVGQPYSDDPAEAYQQFHDRLRQSENFIIDDGEPADSRPRLDTRKYQVTERE